MVFLFKRYAQPFEFAQSIRIVVVLQILLFYFVNDLCLQELVKKYSEFINFPIQLWASKEVDVEVPADEDESAEEVETCMVISSSFKVPHVCKPYVLHVIHPVHEIISFGT